MAVTKIRKTSSWIFIATIIISLIVFGIYYGGGTVDPMAETPEPVYTDVLLYWLYVLLGVVVGFTVFFALMQIVNLLRHDPKSGVLSLGALVAMIAMFFLTYTLGSDVPLVLPGYEGTENVPFWLKSTDMFLYSIYTMVILIVGCIVWGNLRRASSK